VGAVNAFAAGGLFNGQPQNFIDLLVALAVEADSAQRSVHHI
jgi:hypothetical protein